MKILIPTIGTRGDVQPFIALAQGLKRAGHPVTLASHPIMRRLVESHAVTFAPIGPDIDLAREVSIIRYKARLSMTGLINAMRFGFDLLERAHVDIMALCADCDLVVVPTAALAPPPLVCGPEFPTSSSLPSQINSTGGSASMCLEWDCHSFHVRA